MGRVTTRIYYSSLILVGLLLPLLSFGTGGVDAQALTTSINKQDEGTCIVQCLVHLDKYKIATQDYYHRINTSRQPGSASLIKTNPEIYYPQLFNKINRWTVSYRQITHKIISVYIN